VAELNRPAWSCQERGRAARKVWSRGMWSAGHRHSLFRARSAGQARAAFAEQIEALCVSGADLIVVETVSDLYDTGGVRAARDVCSLR